MVLNEYGEIVREEWLKSSEIRSEIRLGEYVFMPNHFHAIVYIVDNRDSRRDDRPVAPTGPTPQSIGALIAGFKSAVTKRINTIRNTPGIAVWQRNYYEHVIRNEVDYHQIAEYITDNPRRWQEDSLHPRIKRLRRGDRLVALGPTVPVGTTGSEPRQP
jgi:REP element-mobilizing transposase RayT